MTHPRVKICGLMDAADAALSAEAGADYLGAILAPGGRRSVTPPEVRVMFASLQARRVGVFVNATDAEVISAAAEAGLHVAQLHGDEPPEQAARLRAAGLVVWKALRPRSGREFALLAPLWAGSVDALLLDGWSAAARGGTGAAFPWAEVAAARDALPQGVDLVAAGGMTADNVAEAVRLLRPAVVDVSSGVERAPGVKDPAAVRRFIQVARGLPS